MDSLRERIARVAHKAIADAQDFNGEGPETWDEAVCDKSYCLGLAYETADHALALFSDELDKVVDLDDLNDLHGKIGDK